MGEMRPQPRVWRLILGFVAAPWPLAALYAWWAAAVAVNGATTSVAAYFAATCLVAYVPIMLMGLPLHFSLRHRLRPRLVWMALCGAGIALFGGLVLILLILFGPHLNLGTVAVRVDLPPGGGPSGSGSQLFAVVAALFAIGFFSGLGALGGLVFWLLVVWGDRRLASAA
jgi:hypothetical protein